MIFRSKKDTNHSLQLKFLKFRHYLQKKTSTYIIKNLGFLENFVRKSWEIVQFRGKSFFKLSFHRSVVMDSLTIELVSNASFNFYPNNSLSSFTKFLPEQIPLKGEWEVAFSEISYLSLYQNVTEGKFTFVDGRESSKEKRIQPMHIEPKHCIQTLLI